MFVDYITKLDLDNYNKENWFIDYAKILDLDDLPGEIWKDVEIVKNIDFKGLYKISNFGRVKSLGRLIINTTNGKNNRFKKENILRQSKGTTGYYQVSLSKNKKYHTIKTHRLVSAAFCKNDDPINRTCVNHIDENKLNNCAYNLEWCTNEYNLNYGMARQKQRDGVKESHRNRKNWNEKEVIQVDCNGNYIKTWRNAKEASKFGYSRNGISLCCKNIQKISSGYMWFYKENYIKENVNKK